MSSSSHSAPDKYIFRLLIHHIIMGNCKKCGAPIAGHRKPWGDLCTQEPIPGFQPQSPSSVDDSSKQPTTEDNPGTSEEGEKEKDQETLDKELQDVLEQERQLRLEVEQAERLAKQEETKSDIRQKSLAVQALQQRLAAAKLAYHDAQKSASAPDLREVAPPLVPKSSHYIPAPAADGATPHGSSQVPTQPALRKGASLQDIPGDTYILRNSANSIAFPLHTYTTPDDILRSNDEAAAMAGLGAYSSARPKSDVGKLPEHYILRPGVDKVDINDIDFPEFCNAYCRMLQTMTGDVSVYQERLSYFTLLTELADQHEWEDVRVFHQVATQQVNLKRERWGNSFASLIRYKLSKAPLRERGGHKLNKDGKKYEESTNNPGVICNNHNTKEAGCTYPRCNRTHACIHCYHRDGSHNKGHRGLECSHRPKPKDKQ